MQTQSRNYSSLRSPCTHRRAHTYTYLCRVREGRQSLVPVHGYSSAQDAQKKWAGERQDGPVAGQHSATLGFSCDVARESNGPPGPPVTVTPPLQARGQTSSSGHSPGTTGATDRPASAPPKLYPSYRLGTCRVHPRKADIA